MEAAILITSASMVIATILLMRRRKARGSGDHVLYQGAIRAIRDGRHPALERFIPYLPPSARGEAPVMTGAEDTIPIAAAPQTGPHDERADQAGASHD